jgi:pyruvate,water dikinase
VLGPRDGGLELVFLIGSKAANLAEIGRLAGPGLVPPWFVVTDRTLRLALAQPPGSRSLVAAGLDSRPSSLREAIDAVLGRAELANHEKSARIRALWGSVELPDAVVAEILEAYRGLAVADVDEPQGESEDAPFVALRSSSREEDTEIAAGAGVFDTFLFVSGSSSLIEHLKRTWSGLWTERAIQHRAVLGTSESEGGGVVIQRIVWSRVSGVLLTINVG